MKTRKKQENKRTLLISPLWETIINRAVFLNEDIIVYSKAESIPDNFDKVVKFLFGEGATVVEEFINGQPSLVIKQASFVLRNARTVDADWTYREVKNESTNSKS